LLNLLGSNVGRRTWNSGLCGRCRHKSGLNNSMKSRSGSISRVDTTILDDMTLFLGVIAKFLAAIAKFLAAMLFAVPSVGHINHRKTTSI